MSWSNLADKLPSAKASEPKCPLCAGKVLYMGLTALDCATFGCDNGPKEDPMAGIVEELKREMEAYNWFPLPWTP